MTQKHKTEAEKHRNSTNMAAPSNASDNHEGAATVQPGGTQVEQGESHNDSDGRLGKLEAENTELKDKLLRALAEVENVRRRAERDVNDMRQYAISKFAGDILSVADNMERAIASIPAEARKNEGEIKTLIAGVELTEKEMQRVLEKYGIRKLSPTGEPFDPHFHEALFEVSDPSVPHGTVSQVVEPGYSIGVRALRPAKVGITSGGSQSRPSSGNGDETRR